MNVVELSGRLVRDVEVRYVGEKQFPIASLSLAVDDGYSRYNRQTEKREVGAGFYKIEVPGDYGIWVADNCFKGDELYVKGSLSQFQSGADKKETKTQVRAEIVIPKTRPEPGATETKPMADDVPMGEEPF